MNSLIMVNNPTILDIDALSFVYNYYRQQLMGYSAFKVKCLLLNPVEIWLAVELIWLALLMAGWLMLRTHSNCWINNCTCCDVMHFYINMTLPAMTSRTWMITSLTLFHAKNGNLIMWMAKINFSKTFINKLTFSLTLSPSLYIFPPGNAQCQWL